MTRLSTARWLSVVVLLVSLAGSAQSADVQVPLWLDRPFLESLLRDRVFTGEGQRLRLSGDAAGCQILELSRPRVRIRGGRMRTRVDALARVGQTVGDRCLRLLDWQGQLELEQQAVVGSDRRSLDLQMASWRALRPDGSPDTLSNHVGHLLEQLLPDALKRVRVGLEGPLADLEALLSLFVTEREASRVDGLLKDISIAAVEIRDDRVAVSLHLPAPAAIGPPSDEPRLSAAERARLQARLEDFDAFLTFVVQRLTDDATSPEQRDVLLDALLEARIRLVEILADPEPSDRDPVRLLFAETWDRLSGTFRELAARQSDHAGALRVLTFVGGGDLLRALDGLGPTTGLDVSRQGLRRLARSLITQEEAGDPLELDERVDPALRRALGFGAPVPPPETVDEQSWLDWLVKPARAAEGLDRALVQKLNRWVPNKQSVNTYLPMVGQVLDHVVSEQLRSKELDRRYHGQFRLLVLATAWQESCWRQFVARKDKRVPLESRSGDLGMMQINPRVWRGFYDLHGLKWDLVYNARAGADILEHFLVRYSLRHREHEKTGRLESLARSAYAAYNGGPREYDRYRRTSASARAKKVDGLFYEKYQAIRSRGEAAVKICFD